MITGQAVYHAINQVRVEHHEKALAPDACLVKEANRRAKEIAKKFAHAHKPFCERSLSGENLSKGYKSTESVKSAWLKSPTGVTDDAKVPFRQGWEMACSAILTLCLPRLEKR